VAGIVLGSVATTAVHDASCSVLVARPLSDAERFPRAIVVGVDGSEESARAAEVARALAARLGSEVRVVVAEGGKGVDSAAVDRIAPEAEVVPGKPVDVLLAAADDADLVVLGHRGLHGVKALGSVGERVVHRASCSVLVVR
jgi:nucleotide-binding universal stress UspA family protein